MFNYDQLSRKQTMINKVLLFFLLYSISISSFSQIQVIDRKSNPAGNTKNEIDNQMTFHNSGLRLKEYEKFDTVIKKYYSGLSDLSLGDPSQMQLIPNLWETERNLLIDDISAIGGQIELYKYLQFILLNQSKYDIQVELNNHITCYIDINRKLIATNVTKLINGSSYDEYILYSYSTEKIKNILKDLPQGFILLQPPNHEFLKYLQPQFTAINDVQYSNVLFGHNSQRIFLTQNQDVIIKDFNKDFIIQKISGKSQISSILLDLPKWAVIEMNEILFPDEYSSLPKNQTLVFTTMDGHLNWLNLRTYETRSKSIGKKNELIELCELGDADHFVTSSQNNSPEIWPLHDHVQEYNIIKSFKKNKILGFMKGVIMSKYIHNLLIIGKNGSVKQLRLEKEKYLEEINSLNTKNNSITLDYKLMESDGVYDAVDFTMIVANDEYITVKDIHSEDNDWLNTLHVTNEMKLTGHEGNVQIGELTRDGKFFISYASDKTIRIWQLETGAEIAKFTVTHPVTSLSISPNDRYLIANTSSGLGGYSIWNIGYFLDLVRNSE